MGVIYKITSPSNRVYIGKTYDLRKRINCHKNASKKNGTSIILHNSISKYGWEAHTLEVIEEVEESLLNEREIFWIKELNTYNQNNPKGLNMTAGGDGQRSSWMHDTARRKKQSERFSGSGGTFYGKKHTKEVKEFISKFMSKRNKEMGICIPKWGAEKGRLNVIKEVIGYDSNGLFIGEFVSYTEAAKHIGVKHASRVHESVSGRRSQCNGFHFRSKTDNYPLQIDVSNVKQQSVKRPVIYFINSYRIEYASSLEASIDLGIPKTTINRAAYYNKLKPIRGGHIFIYKDLYEQQLQKVS